MKGIIRKVINIYYYFMNIAIFKLQRVESSTNIYKNIRGNMYIRNRGKLLISSNVRINSRYSANPIGGQEYCTIIVGKGAEVIIETGAAISNSTIVSNKSIRIGENVFIGGDCKIYDTDFHSLKLEERVQKNDPGVKCKSIIINHGAFIGTGTIILKGVEIGEQAVIGAGSVVTKDIPEREVWAGNPARFIRKL